MFIEIESEGNKNYINVDNIEYIEPKPTGCIIYFDSRHVALKVSYESVVQRIKDAQVVLAPYTISNENIMLTESVPVQNTLDKNTILDIVNSNKKPVGRPRI